MPRFALAAALVAVAASIACTDAAAPADGQYQLTTLGVTGETPVCVLKVSTADGKTTIEVVDKLPAVELNVSNVQTGPAGLSFTLSETRTFKSTKGAPQKLTREQRFTGSGKNAKELLGSLSTTGSELATRAKLTATDKDKLSPIARTAAVEVLLKAQQTLTKPQLLLFRASSEKDKAKQKELLEQAETARKEADEQGPGLLREVIAKHGDSSTALDAAVMLIRMAGKAKLDGAEAKKLLNVIDKQGAPYGQQYARSTLLSAAETLAREPGLEPVALPIFVRIIGEMGSKDSAAARARVLSGYKLALAAETKQVEAQLARLEGEQDAEYKATVPPFKPVAFAGRKDKSANRVAVMELFTGAQCPPCVAADVAFDALAKAYKPTELVLIQYHMHIPGPDPLTNLDTIARWDYYRKTFKTGVTGTPSTLFNGKPQAGGGGGMTAAEGKHKQYRAIIDPLLEETTPTKVSGKAIRSGDAIKITAEVEGGDGDDMRLRFVLVEDTVRYVGSNRLRFHHQVVRAMPGGADGVAVKDKTFRHTESVSVSGIQKNLNAYLTDYAAKVRPFPKADRPMEMKDLKVVAIVQNDKTREIVQAAQLEVEAAQTSENGSR